MKLKTYLTFIILTALFFSSSVNAGNVEKKYINISKEGNQATIADLGQIQTYYGQIDSKLKTLGYDAKGNHASLTGNPSYKEGQLGNALTLNGTNQYAKILHQNAFNFTQALSLEAWVKADKFSTGYQGILLKQSQGNYEMWVYGNRPMFGLTLNGSLQRKTSGMILETGKWYHLTYTYDGSNMKIYVNGELKNTFPATGTINANTSPLFIGWSGYSNEYFAGQIDEVKLWGITLSPEQVKENMEKSPQGNEDRLVGYWSFN